MKQILSIIHLSLLLLLQSCLPSNLPPAFIVVGDSWGQLMCVFKTYDQILIEYGHGNKRAECLHTTKSGSRASEWANPEKLSSVANALNLYPDVKVIVLSVGGNDLLGNWNKNMSAEEEIKLLDTIAQDFGEIILQLQQMRPELKIVVSGYDYPHFGKLLRKNVLHAAYRKLYQKMGQPTYAELNGIIVKFTMRMAQASSEFKNVFYVSNLGLHQHLYGQEEYDIKAGELPAPDKYRLIGGDSSLPQNPRALFHINHTRLYDPYHLNRTGYKNLARNIMNTYLNELIEN
ncbi:MAG: hypothetical protein AB7I27_14790 [Bacteriovoracaceae bacterium]